MQLTEKGASANLPPNVAKTQIFLSWQQPVDFDLLVIAKKKDGSGFDPYYFNNKTGPGIALGDDAGVGDSGGSNNEEATIDNAFWDNYESAMIGVIDYGNVQKGDNGRFDTDTPTVMVMGMDGSGTQVVDHLAQPNGEGLDGNAIAIAMLTRTGPVTSFKVVNNETILKGFTADAMTTWAQGILGG